MKILIIYRSAFGTTKQYAHWLAESTKAKIFKYDISESEIKSADIIIVMSGTYIGFMPLTKFIKNNWRILKNKNVIAVAVGMVDANHKDSKKSYMRIPCEIREKIKFFKLSGKIGKSLEKVNKENIKPIISFIKKVR
jgi:menaquinone-dependent protoporphyrinogen IX oxidase